MIWNNPGPGILILIGLYILAVTWEFWAGDGD